AAPLLPQQLETGYAVRPRSAVGAEVEVTAVGARGHAGEAASHKGEQALRLLFLRRFCRILLIRWFCRIGDGFYGFYRCNWFEGLYDQAGQDIAGEDGVDWLSVRRSERC